MITTRRPLWGHGGCDPPMSLLAPLGAEALLAVTAAGGTSMAGLIAPTYVHSRRLGATLLKARMFLGARFVMRAFYLFALSTITLVLLVAPGQLQWSLPPEYFLAVSVLWYALTVAAFVQCYLLVKPWKSEVAQRIGLPPR